MRSLALLVLLAFVVIMTRLRRQGAQAQKSGGHSLAKGERQRPIMMTWLDPVLSVLFVGSVLVTLIGRGPSYFVAAIIGGLCGLPIALARAKVMYVRPVPGTQMIILRRSAIEYGLLVLLLVVRSAADKIGTIQSGVGTLVLTVGIALGVVESIARSAAITLKYRRDLHALPEASTKDPEQ
jgi:hypothetical protein